MSEGWFCLQRGWRDNPIFKGEFSRGDAWIWLIENACWKPSRVRIKGENVELARGELSLSIRFLAEKWGWSKSRVERFLADLRAESMIETRSKIGTTTGQRAGQGQSIISICNYSKYQDFVSQQWDSADSGVETTAGQRRDKEEQRNKETIEIYNNGSAPPDRERTYAFAGSVIRLNREDFDRWQVSYSDVDLPSILQARDDWLKGRPEPERKQWFHSTSNFLSRKQQEARALAKKEADNAYPIA